MTPMMVDSRLRLSRAESGESCARGYVDDGRIGGRMCMGLNAM